MADKVKGRVILGEIGRMAEVPEIENRPIVSVVR